MQAIRFITLLIHKRVAQCAFYVMEAIGHSHNAERIKNIRHSLPCRSVLVEVFPGSGSVALWPRTKEIEASPPLRFLNTHPPTPMGGTNRRPARPPPSVYIDP